MIELADGDAYLGLREWCKATGASLDRFSRLDKSLLHPYEHPNLYLGGSFQAPLFRRSRVKKYAQEYADYRLYQKHKKMVEGIARSNERKLAQLEDGV